MHGAVAHYLQASKLQAKVGAAHGQKKLTLVESAAVPSTKAISADSIPISRRLQSHLQSDRILQQ